MPARKSKKKQAAAPSRKRTAAKKTAPKAAQKTAASAKKRSTSAKKTAARKAAKQPAAKKQPPKRVAKRTSAPASPRRTTGSKAAHTRRSSRPSAALKTAEPPRNRRYSLRTMLIGRRNKILGEAKDEIARYINGETRQLIDTAIDEGDWAAIEISEDINLRRLAAHRKQMIDIDDAIRKIEEGTYGTCEECGDEISEKRLAVMPTATLCVDCQENREKLEAVGEEGS